jgi:predicted nuclease with TOPRIM domain
MALDRPYVIHYRRPYRCLFLLVVGIMLTVAGLWYFSQQWRLQQTEKLSALQVQHQQLLAENQRLTERNQQLSSKLNDLHQMQAMQQATDSHLQTELQALQDQVINLNKELLFYQNITQGNATSELQVRELHLRSVAEDPALFHYRIVITQGKKITKAIRGDIQLMLNLKEDQTNSPRLLNEHSLKLRHVQVLEGTLRLKENEQPASLLVKLKQGNKTLAERTFEWEVETAPES